ncbi:hypothetical protein TK49_04080 [Ralstonia mannitolilytica]|nr:hypothetical protein TK49_04080 [Ralstonia mannitolilytica]
MSAQHDTFFQGREQQSFAYAHAFVTQLCALPNQAIWEVLLPTKQDAQKHARVYALQNRFADVYWRGGTVCDAHARISA